MTGSDAPAGVGGQQINLQTLVAAIQNAVQAQNLIATNLKSLNATNATFYTALLAILAAAFPTPLTGSATWNPPSVLAASSASTTVSVAGAAVGNFVQVSFSQDLQGMTLDGYVSAADTVTVVLSNLTALPIDLASGTVRVRVT